MTFDLLHSPDALVSDVETTVAAMVARAGLPAPKPSWLQECRSHGYRAMFARAHRSWALSPSRLEIISGYPQTRFGPTDLSANIDDVLRAQRDRPLKTHATVFATSRLPALHAELLERGVRCRLDPPSADLGHERLWIGYADADGDAGSYRPDDDGGLMLEFIPTQCLGLPEPPTPDQVLAAVADAPAAVVRVAARSFIVDDLDRVLLTLAENVGLMPSSVRGAPGRRCARIEVSVARSAVLELIEPGNDEDSATLHAQHGAGTFATRLAVGDLAAKHRELLEAGTPSHWVRRDSAPDTLRVDLGVVPGFLFDFVADADENDATC